MESWETLSYHPGKTFLSFVGPRKNVDSPNAINLRILGLCWCRSRGRMMSPYLHARASSWVSRIKITRLEEQQARSLSQKWAPCQRSLLMWWWIEDLETGDPTVFLKPTYSEESAQIFHIPPPFSCMCRTYVVLISLNGVVVLGRILGHPERVLLTCHTSRYKPHFSKSQLPSSCVAEHIYIYTYTYIYIYIYTLSLSLYAVHNF